MSGYQVTIHHQGQTFQIQVSKEQTVLEAALSQGIDLPSSCQAGVCTTCAGRLSQGDVDQAEAMGIAPEIKQKGYVLLCVAKPCSDLEVESNKEDEVYELQFGTGG